MRERVRVPAVDRDDAHAVSRADRRRRPAGTVGTVGTVGRTITAGDHVDATLQRSDERPPLATPDRSRIQRSTAPVERITPDASAVIRRVNTFYSNFPKSETKESPLATIARNLNADAGVRPNELRDHWLKNPTLKIAKTAKTHLTAGPMQTVERPVEAAAWLDTPNPNPGTRKDPTWVTAIGNLGTVEDQILGDTPKKYNGGHLIAWEFLNDAANVRGNIAPQSDLQNQALFRRVERMLEHTIKVQGGPGIEVGVSTPYRNDNYSVTYRQLFERRVLTDPQLEQRLQQAGLLDKALTFAQMAPDTYDTYFLTQTGTTSMVPADAREHREGVTTFALPDYSESTANRLHGQPGVPKLSIFATNYNPVTGDQDVTSFAHLVYLNHRSTAGPVAPQVAQQQPASARWSAEEREARRRIALAVINEHGQLAFIVQQALELEFGLSPTESSYALLEALMESEPG